MSVSVPLFLVFQHFPLFLGSPHSCDKVDEPSNEQRQLNPDRGVRLSGPARKGCLFQSQSKKRRRYHPDLLGTCIVPSVFHSDSWSEAQPPWGEERYQKAGRQAGRRSIGMRKTVRHGTGNWLQFKGSTILAEPLFPRLPMLFSRKRFGYCSLSRSRIQPVSVGPWVNINGVPLVSR